MYSTLDDIAFEMVREACVEGTKCHSQHLFPKPKRLNAQGQKIERPSPKERKPLGMGVG